MKSKKNKLIVAGIEDIAVAGDNPRIIDEKSAGFCELAESIAAQGVIVPVHVRTDPAVKKPYELLAGERRLRAAKKAGLESIPAIDHGDIGDDEAFEITFAENFQRRDLTVLEHGKAVSILLKKYSGDFAAVASKLGKSEKWVRTHDRIETELIISFRTAVSAGGNLEYFTPAHLALVARFPAETQKKIFGKLLQSYGRVTVGELDKMVTDMLRILAKAKFDTAACAKCIKRSSAQPGLWSEPVKSGKPDTGDKCLDPACWEKKDIAAAKAEFKEKAKKYPGLVAITKDYYFNRDEGKRLPKIYGKVLTKGDYQICKKADKGSMPAVMAGTRGGKIHYIKPRKEVAAAKPKSTPIKRLRAELEKKRRGETAHRIANRISEMKFADICSTDKGPILDEGVFRVLLMVSVYGCDCTIVDAVGRMGYIESVMKDYTRPAVEKDVVFNEIAAKLWHEVAHDMIYDVDICGDDSSQREARLLALLFGLDIDAEYANICGEPAFAEPAEWTAKAKKKVKSKKAKGKKKSTAGNAENAENAEKKVKSKKRKAEVRTCRVCGCTDTTPCIVDGVPCSWVEDIGEDLCSACEKKMLEES